MTSYQLTPDAENDLKEIAQYTLKQWGSSALVEYKNGLREFFVKLANDEVMHKKFSDKFKQLKVAKYKSHYIFYISNEHEVTIIIGVIHEKRDIVNRLKERLE